MLSLRPPGLQPAVKRHLRLQKELWEEVSSWTPTQTSQPSCPYPTQPVSQHVQRRPFPILIISFKVKCTVPPDILALPPTTTFYTSHPPQLCSQKKNPGVPPTIETAKPEQARPTTEGSPQIPVPIPHCKGVAVLGG